MNRRPLPLASSTAPHTPAVQSPPRQSWSHAPQWAALVSGSMHSPPHSSSSPAHMIPPDEPSVPALVALESDSPPVEASAPVESTPLVSPVSPVIDVAEVDAELVLIVVDAVVVLDEVPPESSELEPSSASPVESLAPQARHRRVVDAKKPSL